MDNINKIIIVGNGFDIASGLSTSYTDFSKYLLNETITNELLNYSKDATFKGSIISNTLSTKVKKRALKQKIYSIDSVEREFVEIILAGKREKIQEFLNKYPRHLHKYFDNLLLGQLFHGNYNNWFDVENVYFSKICDLKNDFKNQKNYRHIKAHANRLNMELEFIKTNLKIYLQQITMTRNADIQKFLHSIFFDSEEIYIINFNYTNNIEQYTPKKPQKIQLSYIHGNLKNDDIIFGFGNDQNDEYEEIKASEIDEFLENFKTFKYLLNNEYERLHLNALNVFREYDVHVIGHSLGSTDKTLLDEIFNSKRCNRIHLYKRLDLSDDLAQQKKEFNKLLFAASRILVNEKEMRKKVVSFPNSKFFPLKKPI